ncbi:probable G-protein coupled receptor 52 [Stylophora pistillata]|nr:probable G-protein coupled receptor 52 [Stylophora pistillata]
MDCNKANHSRYFQLATSMHNNSTSAPGLGSQARLLEGFGLSLVLLVSLVLNLSVCAIICRTKSLREKPTNTFVANLCTANLLLTACVIPFSLVTIIEDEHASYSKLFCQANGFISVVSSVAIVMTLCCISLDRYIAVTRPTRYKIIVTVKRAWYTLLVVWGQGLLYATFPIFGWSRYEYHPGTLHCSPAWTSECSLYIYLAVVGFGIPMTVMVFTYIRIFFVMRRHARKVSTIKRTRPKVKNNNCKLISMKERGSVKPHSTQNSSHEDKSSTTADKLYSSAANEQMLCSSTANLSELNCRAKQFELNTKTDAASGFYLQKGEKVSFATELPLVNTCEPGAQSNSSKEPSDVQRSTRGMMRIGETLRKFWPRKRRRNQRPLSRELKVAKTGVLLLFIFIILWLPYMVVHICSSGVKAPPTVFRLTMWLVFMNGVLNPIAYALGNSTVKMKFRQMFSTVFSLCCKCRWTEGQRVISRMSARV